MPSQILHSIFGEDVIFGLYNVLIKEAGGRFILTVDKAREKIFHNYYSAFILGCQGPDIFYHSQKHKPVALEYGSLLHRRSYGIFSAHLLKTGLLDSSPDEGDIKNHRREKVINAHGVYALGFMTHAILDRFCHPYIIYRAGKHYHSFFERIIDVLMLKELRGLDPASWDRERLLADICENPPLGLRELIARSLASAFPQKADRDRSLARRIDNTFIDCARFYGMTSPSKIKTYSAGTNAGHIFTRRSLNYVYPENLPEDIDFLNLNHKTWHYPYIPANGLAREDNRSFLEIYSDALKTAIDALAPCILLYIDCGIFPIAATAGKIGNESLSIQNEEGRPCAPNLTDPLPFEEVMEQQARLRGVEC